MSSMREVAEPPVKARLPTERTPRDGVALVPLEPGERLPPVRVTGAAMAPRLAAPVVPPPSVPVPLEPLLTVTAPTVAGMARFTTRLPLRTLTPPVRL